MLRLPRYIFSQCAGPLFFFTLVLSGVVWLSQSLKMLDLVINRGQSALVFLQLSVLLFPSLLTVVLPIALFCALLYALNRLYNDSELIVMWSAGVGRWAIARPIIFLAILVAIVNLFLNLYLMPTGYRTMKDKVYEIRGDLAAKLLKEGVFTNPSKGLTVYIREVTPNGELKSILVHDNRDRARPVTYLAQTGALMRNGSEPYLLMREGSIQAITSVGRPPTLTSFDKYTFSLVDYMKPASEIRREFSERFLSELLYPDMTKKWDRENARRLVAEAHNRLASPLYNLAFAMAAIVAVACGAFNRRGHVLRLLSAIGIIILIRITGFAAQSGAGSNPSLLVVQYIIPLATIAACGAWITDWNRLQQAWIRHRAARQLNAPGS